MLSTPLLHTALRATEYMLCIRWLRPRPMCFPSSINCAKNCHNSPWRQENKISGRMESLTCIVILARTCFPHTTPPRLHFPPSLTMFENLFIHLNDKGKEMGYFSILENCFWNVVTIFQMTIFLSCQTKVGSATGQVAILWRVLVCWEPWGFCFVFLGFFVFTKKTKPKPNKSPW